MHKIPIRKQILYLKMYLNRTICIHAFIAETVRFKYNICLRIGIVCIPACRKWFKIILA